MSDGEVRVPAGLTTEGLLGARYMARFLDSILIVLLAGAFLGLGQAILTKPVAGGLAGVLFVLFNLSLVMVIWIGYFTAFESSQWQATLGKRFMELRVYNSQADRPTPLQAAGRTLVKDGPFLVFAVIPGGRLLALIWFGAHLVVLHRSPVYQAIHDRAAHTWVAAPEGTTQLHLS
ncbi:MAG: RDD family protein [Bryobacteraceae bacterium]|jgi:uncharacterized RDD family membrane protein YckC